MIRFEGLGLFFFKCIMGQPITITTHFDQQLTKQEEEGGGGDGDGQPPAEEPEPLAWDAYPRGPEWEKEAEANAVFLGELGAIDAAVDRVRYVLCVACVCMPVRACI